MDLRLKLELCFPEILETFVSEAEKVPASLNFLLKGNSFLPLYLYFSSRQVSRACRHCRVTTLLPCCHSLPTLHTQDSPSTRTRARTLTRQCCCTRRLTHTLQSHSSPKDWTYMHTSSAASVRVWLCECVYVCWDGCVCLLVCCESFSTLFKKREKRLVPKVYKPT